MVCMPYVYTQAADVASGPVIDRHFAHLFRDRRSADIEQLRKIFPEDFFFFLFGH